QEEEQLLGTKAGAIARAKKEIGALIAQGKALRAGDVLEMKAVYLTENWKRFSMEQRRRADNAGSVGAVSGRQVPLLWREDAARGAEPLGLITSDVHQEYTLIASDHDELARSVYEPLAADKLQPGAVAYMVHNP